MTANGCSGGRPQAGPLAARHLSAHDVSLDLHRGVGDRDEPGGVSVGVSPEECQPGRDWGVSRKWTRATMIRVAETQIA